MKLRALWALVLVGWLAVPAGRVGAQWVQTNGPYGGGVLCLAVSDSNFFAGTGCGVFRSTNNGTTWMRASAGLPNININALAIHGETLFAGTDSGLYCSLDEGISWQQETYLDGWGGAPAIWAIHAGDIAVLVGTSSGVFRTTDNGGNWERVNSMWVNCFAEIGADLFAGEFSGVFRSVDDGTRWTQVNKGLTDTNVSAMVAVGTTLFAGCFGTENDLFRSSDSGTTWRRVSNGLPTPDTFVRSIRALGTDGANVFAATSSHGVYRSTNDGADWEAVNNGLDNCSREPFAFSQLASGFVVGTAAGAYITSDNGNSWREIDSGLGYAGVTSLIVSGGKIFASTDCHGIFQSSDDGANWSASGLANSTIRNFALCDTDFYVTSSEVDRAGEAILRSSDNGLSWRVLKSGIPGYFPVPFAISESKIFVAVGSQVFWITNADTLWSNCDSIPSTQIVSLLSTDSNLFAGTTDEGVFRSKEGIYWAWPSTGYSDTSVVQCLVTNGKYLFAATRSGVSRSSDSGRSWSESARTSWRPEWATITAFYAKGDNVFVATDWAGIFLSTDDGVDWKDVNTGLPYAYGAFTIVNALSLEDSILLAGTGQGVWRRPLSDFGISSVPEHTLPSSDDIHSYPNPFTQSARISFSLDEEGYAQVSIVNTLGAEVARLYSGTLGAGEHEFTWNPDAVAPGNYWCIVRTSEGVQRIGMLRE